MSMWKKQKKLRVLHIGVALYQPYLMVKALRELGYKADLMVWDDLNVETTIRGWDINLKVYDKKFKLPLLNKIYRMLKCLIFFTKSIFKYDVFHFHSCASMFYIYDKYQKYLDIKLLKLLNKKVITQWWGCDIRLREMDIKYDNSACNICSDIKRSECVSEYKILLDKVTKKYCDARLSNGDLKVSYTDFVWMNNVIDAREWSPEIEVPERFRLPNNGTIKIYHSFANSKLRNDVKGTYYIQKAVEELKSEGYNIEFIFFNNVKSEELKYYQVQADIVVDQLKCGFHGSTAVECMALGKPVICYIRDDVREVIPKEQLSEFPIVEASIYNIKDVIRELIDYGEKRIEIGRKSREYVLKYHDMNAVAKRLIDIYCGRIDND